MSTPDAIAGDVRGLSLHKKKQIKHKAWDLEEDAASRKPSRSEPIRLIRLSGKGKGKASSYVPTSSAIQTFDSEGPGILPRYVPYTPRYEILDPQGRLIVVDENTTTDEGGPCQLCSAEHPRCDVCYKFHHSWVCPYFNKIPKGANFNPRYFVCCVCCGAIFNEDKWICTGCCATTALLRTKRCGICNDMSHLIYECPVDKVGAAVARSHREEVLSREPVSIPYLG